MHRLIQAVTMHQLTPEQRNHVRSTAADLVLAALPKATSTINWPVYRMLLPHARNVLPLDSPGLEFLTTYLSVTGDYRIAVDLQQQIHTHVMTTLGTEHPRTLTTWYDLACWMGEVGDAAGARDQFAALLPIQERVLGAEHPYTLTTRHNVACWMGEVGDAAAARDQFAALLPIRERVLGVEHPRTLTTRGQLAHWTGEAGDEAAARDQFAALLPIQERVLGAKHPRTLKTRRRLAHWTEKAEHAKSSDA
ncbi:tetratricopeptide repeat protein [Nonomuraea sp. NPDC049141]|uniref:tetratricopeptide repeat protein n=1 Tax=Nonomuraea sp. NPDC049141 TaxID=3155500 RepID=UPI0033DBDA87